MDRIEDAISLRVTNPRAIAKAGGYDYCPQWHEYKLRRYARALEWTYPEMTLIQLKSVHEALEKRFGYSTIVRLRCGYEAISPDEQAIIESIFDEYATGHKPIYKAFEEHYVRPPRVEGKKAHKLIK